MNTVKTGKEWLMKDYRYSKAAEITSKDGTSMWSRNKFDYLYHKVKNVKISKSVVIQQNKISTFVPKTWRSTDMDYIPRLPQVLSNIPTLFAERKKVNKNGTESYATLWYILHLKIYTDRHWRYRSRNRRKTQTRRPQQWHEKTMSSTTTSVHL